MHGKWPQDARKLAIDDRFIDDSITNGITSGAILLLIECNERVPVTAIAVDGDFVDLLQGNDGGYFREPLYYLFLAAVHSLAQKTEDDRKPPENQDLLRLPVINGSWKKFNVLFPSAIGLNRNVTNVHDGGLGYADELDWHCEYAQIIVDITKPAKATVKQVNCGASSQDGSYHHQPLMGFRHAVYVKRDGESDFFSVNFRNLVLGVCC